LKLRKARSGLTLIEIVVVVMVLGFMIGMTLSSIKNILIPSTEDMAEKLSNALKFAYKTSRIDHSTVFLELDLEEEQYRLVKLVRTDKGLIEKEFIKPKKMPFLSEIIYVQDLRGTKTENGKIRIPFDHSGISENFFIYLGRGGNVVNTIQVFKYAGKVKVHKGEFQNSSSTNAVVDYGIDWKEDSKLDNK
jgi:general secretion pathway protein H